MSPARFGSGLKNEQAYFYYTLHSSLGLIV